MGIIVGISPVFNPEAGAMYPVPANIVAQGLQILDEANYKNGNGPLSEADIREATGRSKITRQEIVALMDKDEPCLIPASQFFAIGSRIEKAAWTIIPSSAYTGHGQTEFNRLLKVRDAFAGFYLQGRATEPKLRPQAA